MRNFHKAVLLSACLFTFWSCSDSSKGNRESANQVELKSAPVSNADSAYAFVQRQVDFGPRIPNTQAHKEAAEWFKLKFESYNAQVIMQEFEENVYDGTKVSLTNVIASFYPEKKKRILLAAHWDTRPFSDHDDEDEYAQLDGANDGGSGVGVLLEVARVLSTNDAPNVGVDIILFDGEDWGPHDSEGPVDLEGEKETWWCLGSQYWSRNKHKPNYSAFYGVLLDMVGAPNATFHYDSVSQGNAGRILDKVWDIGINLGHGSYFKKSLGFTGITDDHVYVNSIARIPMIDIIDYREPGSFTPVWHTQNDNMENISKETLRVVTEVILTMLYNE